MKIYLASSVTPESQSLPVREVTDLAGRDRFGIHGLAQSAETADLILFVDNHVNPDWRVRAMLEHPLLKQFPEKCMVHEERPFALGLLPGVYVSMPRKFFDLRSQRAWSYYKLPAGVPPDRELTPRLLYSYRGQLGQRISPAYRLRSQILALRDDRAIIEPVRGFSPITDNGDPAGHLAMKKRYANTLAEAKFILSPRGYATSSFRCYEAMRAGRVPVILADEWVPPVGPDWEKCAIFIPENRVRQIPEILRAAEPKWEAMAAEALRAFNLYFAPDVNWHNLMEQFRVLKESNAKIDPALVARRIRKVASIRTVSQLWGKAAGMAKRLG